MTDIVYARINSVSHATEELNRRPVSRADGHTGGGLMESWRMVWRDGFVPVLSTRAWRPSATPSGGDDPRLTQGSTTTPPPLMCVQDWPVEAACALGLLRLAGRRAGDGRRGRGVLRPLLLRGRPAPRRAGRLPLVPQLVRRHPARRDAPASCWPRSNGRSPSAAATGRARPCRRASRTRSPACRWWRDRRQPNQPQPYTDEGAAHDRRCRHCRSRR